MSTNVSKQKREDLIKKAQAIRNYIEKAPQDENTEQLLKYIAELEKDINGKKYGLVFEEHRESIDELLETHTPVLTEDESLFIDNDGQMNFLIEGDNLVSLKLLEKTHKGKIDLIIIDPPYNTGNSDFTYDDIYIDNTDFFSHSKWASFMSKRLKIAYDLLSEDGYIFIDIDENELYALKLLTDDIFLQNNFVGMYMWEKTSTPPALSKKIRKKLEYVLCYAKNLNSQHQFSQGRIDGGDAPLLNTGNPLKKLTFPIGSVRFKIADGLYKKDDSYKIKLYDDVMVENGTNKLPFTAEAEFKWGQKMLDEEIKNGTYFIVKSNNFSIRYQRVNIEKVKTPQNILNAELGVGTNEEAKKEISSLNISLFSYPKPTSLYSFLIKMINQGNNLNVLDFFAGSGTTGHAVMKLNAEDGGNRKFILCTNNENNICRDVTYERIKRVIEKEDYKASLKYFKIDYLPIDEMMYYEYADEILKHVKELVELENGINFSGNAEIAIILTENALDEFVETMPDSCRAIYISHDVLPTEEQEILFNERKIAVNVIPNYYYKSQQG